jgi:CheY-like chemotaxis protein
VSVLIVDDDAFNQYSISELILSLGDYNVKLGNHGEEAINIVKEMVVKQIPLFDIIIMDLNMPIMNGMTAT